MKEVFQKFLSALLLSVFLFFEFIFPFNAVHAQTLPFGGQILVPIFCDYGIYEPIGPPRPCIDLACMYLPGATISYAWVPPVHTGQWVLGMSGPPVPCFIGPDYFGSGNLMLFVGAGI